MRCLHCHSSVLPLHSRLKHKQKLKAKEQLWLFSSEAPRLVLQRQKDVRNSIVPLSTNAISNTLFIAAKIPPSQSGDITVFLQTSTLFHLQVLQIRQDRRRSEDQ
ncbi:hypothetical protein CRYUN_Cryun11dG0017300 [Craigia yunnanensis]